MQFLDDDILLGSQTARELYHNVAKDLPIVDYHCHIDAADILGDKRFDNITQLWLSGDHYKWRLMRSCGVDENLITGDAPDREKFLAFADCLPRCIGNPIYIWCHLELKKYFAIADDINARTAHQIYDLTQEKLKNMSARSIIASSNVRLICTTDDPIDGLDAHLQLKVQRYPIKVLPTFRPDRALNADSPQFAQYMQKLSQAAKVPVDSLEALKRALSIRLDYFILHGCFISDHALSSFVYADCTQKEAESLFLQALKQPLNAVELEKFQTHMLLFLAHLYTQKNICMQLHFSCLRNNNRVMFAKLGADSGFDCMGAGGNPYKLSRLFDCLYAHGSLPKTIVYSLNPADDKLINTVINCFQHGREKSRIQHGSAWWFNDTQQGMYSHMRTLAEYGVLGNFIGMLTDSRSFTSYVRHDYFRRILCDFVGGIAESGQYTQDSTALQELVQNISYYNVQDYMGIRHILQGD